VYYVSEQNNNIATAGGVNGSGANTNKPRKQKKSGEEIKAEE
jgi:hypothetical protein